MSRKITSCCVALLLALTSVFGVQRKLDSIRDEHLPADIRTLLHWFANQVNIYNRNAISLRFDPSSGDHGSHHYGNFERLLEPPYWGYKYYSVGNLNQATFPTYVETACSGQNAARIIFSSIRENNGWTVGRVFITRHLPGSNQYDPEHTYEVTTRVLREIRSLYDRDIQGIAYNSGFRRFTNTSGARLQGHYYQQSSYQTPRATDQGNCDCGMIVFIAVIVIIVLVLIALSSHHVNK